MKLLIVTQVLDRSHPALGFFVEWVETVRRHPSVRAVQVITTNGEGTRIGRVFRFWRAVMTDRSDAVFVHMTPLWLVLGWPVWKWRGAKTVLWYTHGQDTALLRWAVRLADVTCTATQQAFPFVYARVKAVGHGIAPAFLSLSRAERPPGRFACLAVGRVAPRKRVRETIALFAHIQRLEPRATLTWVGSLPAEGDAYARMVSADIRRLGLEQAVSIGSHVTAAEMPAVYAQHDLLLHLSETGSLDKVVLEALATGCPVLSTSAATQEALGDAWFWPGRLDTAAAEEALRRLSVGVASGERERVGSTFALESFIHRLLSLFI